jgi:uncharacterized protein YndB with AHSA1/START domain
MTSDKRTTVYAANDREIRVERTFATTPQRLWRALTEPSLIVAWRGRGNRLAIERLDFRAGGLWRFVEHSAQGERGIEGRFREVTAPERIVQTTEWDAWPAHVAVEQTTLEAIGDGETRLVIATLFHTREERDAMLGTGLEQGFNESHAALEALLSRLH